MRKNEILKLTNGIKQAANRIYIIGCDGVAMSNLQQLNAICQMAQQIEAELARPEPVPESDTAEEVTEDG